LLKIFSSASLIIVVMWVRFAKKTINHTPARGNHHRVNKPSQANPAKPMPSGSGGSREIVRQTYNATPPTVTPRQSAAPCTLAKGGFLFWSLHR
jgi:hypothetical protein